MAVAVQNSADDDDAAPVDAAVFAFSSWTTILVKALRDAGVAHAEAADTATLIVAAVEGAVAMSRAERSTDPLAAVGRRLHAVLAALEALDSRHIFEGCRGKGQGLGDSTLEVRDDRLGQPVPGLVEIDIGTELTLGGDATHRTRDEQRDLTHPGRVHVQIGECVLAVGDPGLLPGRQLGRGLRVMPLQVGPIARECGPQVLDGPGIGGAEAVVEDVQDPRDALRQRNRAVRRVPGWCRGVRRCGAAPPPTARRYRRTGT